MLKRMWAVYVYNWFCQRSLVAQSSLGTPFAHVATGSNIGSIPILPSANAEVLVYLTLWIQKCLSVASQAENHLSIVARETFLLSIYLSIYLSLSLSIYVYIYIYLSLYIYIYLYIYILVYIYIYLYT